MLQLDSVANLALRTEDVCALDVTRVSNPEQFRKFAEGIAIDGNFLHNERWSHTAPPQTASGVYDHVMHEMLPTVYNAAWLETQGGHFGIRLTGVGDYTVLAINRRVVTLSGLPTDVETGLEAIDFEMSPDIFLAFARGLLLNAAEDLLEEEDEFEDREISETELMLHGIPAGGACGADASGTHTPCAINHTACGARAVDAGACFTNAGACGALAGGATACGGNAYGCAVDAGGAAVCAANANGCAANTFAVGGCAANATACGAKAGAVLACAANATTCAANATGLGVCAANAGACAAKLGLPCSAYAVYCVADASGGLSIGGCVVNLPGSPISACIINVIPLLPSC